jgi:excinuclease ABC subunit C
VFKRAGQIGRPCLLGYIGKCAAPCVGRVDAEEHRKIVDDFCDFMAGKTESMIKRLEREMAAASENLEFEKAARLRDDLGALRRALEKQAVVLGDGTDADVVAFAQDELEAAVQVFHVRGGRVRGQRGWIVDKVEAVTTGELVEQFLLQVYGGVDEQTGVGEAGEAVPREVLVPELPDDADVYTELLEELRGGKVSLRVPQRGDKRSLLETVERNAKEAFARHRVKRSSDLTARSLALSELQEALELPDAPLRIECMDVSHVQGTNVVASMVVFEDGLAKKSDYRRFSVAQGTDDTAAMAEVVRRRFARHLKDEEDRRDEQGISAEEGRPRRFAYPPNLLVVDGGAPQVAAASRSLAELGIVDVAVCGLAKRMEEVWLPGDNDPVILPRTSEALYLLQRVRDEAHRFAITYHRQKRSTSMLVSLLDDVPGLGESRRKALMKQFGSLKRLRAASVEELMAVPGIGRRTAEAVQAAIAEPADPAGAAADSDGAGESTTAPQGPAERGAPRPDAGDTAVVGLVAS